MRPLWPSFVFLLLQEAESAAPDGTPTTVAALNLSSLPPRGEVTASVKPIPVQLQDGSGDKSGDKHEEKEERFGLPQTSSVLEGATHVAGWNGWLSVPLDFPIDRSKFSKIFEKSNIVNEDQVMQWLTKFHTPGQSFRGDDLVTGLVRDGHGKELVRLFQEMRFFPELKERAAMMQRALLAQEPKLSSSAFDVWLGAKVTPAEAFHMMPISAKKRPLVAVKKNSPPTEIFYELGQWLTYVRDYRLKWNDFSHDQVIDVLVRASLPEEQLVQLFYGLRGIVVNEHDHLKLNGFSDDRLIDVLVHAGLSREELGAGLPGKQSVQLSDRLRGLADMTKLVDALQRRLVLRSQNSLETLKLMFDGCLDSKVDPKEVYHMMPILWKKSLPIPIEKPKHLDVLHLEQQRLDALYSKPKLWIDYVYKFRFENPSLRDDLVIDVLLADKRPEVELVSFFNWLRDMPDMKERADLLQKKLALRSSAPLITCTHLIKAWKKAAVSLEDAYHMMPFSLEKRLAAGEEPSTPASYQMLKLWIDYGYENPSASSRLWDDRVIDVLLADKRPEKELVSFLNWLRGRPNTKERADLLQKNLAFRLMAPLAGLQLRFDVWRKFKMDLEGVYHNMFKPAKKKDFRDVVATRSSWPDRFSKLEIWIKYVFESGNPNIDYGRVIAVLLKDERPVEELVIFFNWLRGRPDMTETADLLQKELALKVPTSNTLELMIHAWMDADAKVRPDEAYHMIHFPVEKSFLDALAVVPDLPASFTNRELWIGYVVAYRNKGRDFSDDQVIELLVDDKISEDELVNFFNWLRRRPKMKETADLLQKKLALRSLDPAKTWKLVTDAWEPGVSLEDAYRMMPIPAAKSSDRVAGEKSIWLANYNLLQHWLRYASKSESEVNDEQVIKLLVADNMNTLETIQFFRRLRLAPDLRAYANTLEGMLIARLPEIDVALDNRINAWISLRVTPQEAYPMIISAENRLTVADGEMSSVPVIFRIHKKWVKYVYTFRSSGGVFNDDEVIKVLSEEKRSDFSVVEFLKWLQDEPDMKKRADMLLNKLLNPAVLSKTS
uniref:RXLR phytopathogen effector protein WY-domain domain-containing protein n=1 Tax=Peronospora matthiolae TaxID=2874970 RepID=A0AAV1U386_9STRA